MINQIQQSIKSCVHCLQHDGHLPKVSSHPIVATAALDLLHIDFTSIEMTMEQNQLPRVTNVLVFQDPFIMVYVIPIKQQNSHQVPVSGLHLDLWGPGLAPEQSGC